jgi:hypothetical protein
MIGAMNEYDSRNKMRNQVLRQTELYPVAEKKKAATY